MVDVRGPSPTVADHVGRDLSSPPLHCSTSQHHGRLAVLCYSIDRVMSMSVVRLGLVVLLSLHAMTAAAAAGAGEADIRLVGQGREVALEEHLAPGKLVLFDFYADWCAPCRTLTPRLETLTRQFPDRLALRKIDVVDWESPVARQHGIGSLPHLVLFGPDGTRLAEGDANRVLRVLASELGIESGGRRGFAAGSSVPKPVWIAFIAALVVGSIIVLRRARAATPRVRLEDAQPAADGGSPRIWYAMVRGSLEGPYSVGELAGLAESGSLAGESQVRRRGDSGWQRLDDVLRST